MKKILSMILFIMYSSSTYGASECTFDIDSVYLDTEDGGFETVWIQLRHSGGAPAIYKNATNTLSQAQVNRLYSMALTGFSADKKW